MRLPLLLVALFLLVAQYWIAAGAVVVVGLLTFAGGWLTGRREHGSWLRDQRANRYQELATRSTQLRMSDNLLKAELANEGAAEPIQQSRRIFLDAGETGSLQDAYARTVRAFLVAAAAVEVIGPEEVAAAAAALQRALFANEPGEGDQDDAIKAADRAFLTAARRALGAR